MISKFLPAALNFKSFSRSLEQFFLTVGQNNFGNKIPFFTKNVNCFQSLFISSKLRDGFDKDLTFWLRSFGIFHQDNQSEIQMLSSDWLSSNLDGFFWRMINNGSLQITSVTLYQRIYLSSRTSNIESNKSQNGGLEDYNNIYDGIFPHFITPYKKISLG